MKEALIKNNIDVYIIKTKEGCDKVVENVFGYAIVGEAYLFLTSNKCYAITSVIDYQDSEECGFFDEVFKYSKEGAKPIFDELINKINPKTVALNVSKNNYKADGFTVGSYRDFVKTLLNNNKYKIISSEIFIDTIF